MLPALLLAAYAAWIAWRLRWLTTDGAVAACAVGTAVLHFGGWRWAGALLAFFLTGSALTRLGRERKSQPEHEGRGRNAGQVLGTGGIAALISVLWGTGVVPEPARTWLPAAFLGALATSTADTWATEVGMLSRVPPRLVTTWARVPAGTSGGVTLTGSLAGVAGAALIAGIGSGGDSTAFLAAWIAGAGAMFVDSLLGATVQASFRRPDGSLSEEPARDATLIRGVRWITNPVINALSTLAGALAAALLAGRV